MQAALRPRFMVTLMLVCAVMAVVLTATPEAGAQEPPDPTPTPEETKGAGGDEDEPRYHVTIRPPTGFQRKSGTVDSITMEWDAVTDASDYWLEIASATAEDWSTVTAIITGTEETADDLDCGTAYRFRVRSFPEGDPDVHLHSDPTTPVEASTEPCRGPTANTPTVTYAGRVSVDLEWVAVADDDLTLPNDYVYQVEHSVGNSNTWSDISTATGGTTKTLIVRPCGMEHHFRIKAKENSTAYATTFGPPSGSDSATLACNPVVTVERHAAAVTEGDVATFRFRATPVSEYRDITVTYRVTVEANDLKSMIGTTTIEQEDPFASINLTTIRDNVHLGDGSVTVTITNLNVVRSEPRFYGIGTANAAVTVIRDDDAPPPAELRISDPWPQSLSLTWDAVPDGHGYRLERRTAGSARWVPRAADTAATRFVDTGLAPDTRYYYRVSTRGDGRPYVASFTLTYAEMNERTTVPPDFEPDAYTFRVNAPVQSGTGVGHVRATPPNPGESIRYSLQGTGANPAFRVGVSTGQIIADRTLNVSPGTTYTFTAVATDIHGAEDTASVTVRINYPPVFAPGNVSFVVTQGAASGTVVGTVRATDEDPEDTVSHTLTGPGAGTLFRIAEGTGRITLGRALTAYPPASYALTVTATDPLGATGTKAVTVRVNRPPDFSAARFGFDVVKTATVGTLVGTASATDPDRDALTYAFASSSVVGNLFTINTNTGAIAVGSGLASTTGATVTFGVEVRDVHNALDTATVTVSLLPPPPLNLRVTYLSRANVDLAWDSPDPAAAFTYRIEQNEGDPTDLDFEDQWMPSLFSVTNTSGKVIGLTCGTTSGRTYHFRVVAQGDGVSHAAKEGPPSERESETLHCTNEVTIAADSAQVTEGNAAEFTISLNRPFAYRAITVTYLVTEEGGYATAGTFTATIARDTDAVDISIKTKKNDDVHRGDGSVTVTIYNVSVPRGEPRFYGIGTANAATVTIRDDDAPPPGTLTVMGETAQSLTLTWDGVENGHGYKVERQLLATQGWITVAADTAETTFVDTELQPDTLYTYRVSTRGDGSPYVASFTRTWIMVDGRTLALNSPPVFEADAYTFRVNAPVQSGAAVGQVRATDANPMDIISYALRDTGTNSAFQIDATTGQVTATRRLTAAPGTTYTFTAVATDNHGAEDTASTTVRVNHPPAFSTNDASFVVTLGATTGMFVGRVTATDADPGDTLTYTLTGSGAGTLFRIGQESGQITLGMALTAYPPASYALTVTVTDPVGASAAKAVTVRVNRPPAFSETSFAFGVIKTAPVGTVVGSASAADPDMDNLTYSFASPSDVGALFTLDSGTGDIAVGSGLAAFTGTSVTFDVEVEDAHRASVSAGVTVALNPAPPENVEVVHHTQTTVTIGWDSPDTTAALTYRIERNDRDPDEENFADGWSTSVSGISDTERKVIELTCGDTEDGNKYHFRVVAQGDGVSYAAVDSRPSGRVTTTLHCTNEATITPASGNATQVAEGSTAAFTISLTRPFDHSAITVRYRVSGTADFLGMVPDERSVTIPAGRDTAKVSVSTKVRKTCAINGTLMVTIFDVTTEGRAEPRFYTIGSDNSATLTIVDAPCTQTPVVGEQIDDVELTLGGESMTIELSDHFRDPDGNTGLVYAVNPTSSTVVDIDFDTKTGTLVLSPLTAGSVELSVSVCDPGGLAAEQSFTVTVKRLPLITIERSSMQEITEGDSALFELTANPPPAADLTVHLRVSVTTSFRITGPLLTQVTIPADETTAVLIVPTAGDNLDEADGNVIVTVRRDQMGSDYNVGRPLSAGVTVLDDDVPPAPTGLSANGNIENGVIQVWWRSNSEPTGFDLRYAIEQCHDQSIGPIACAPGDWTVKDNIIATFTTLTAGTEETSQLAPSTAYRLQVRTTRTGHEDSEWSSPALVYPTGSPPRTSTVALGRFQRPPMIATAPLYGFQESGQFSYIICERTIPDLVTITPSKIVVAARKWDESVMRGSSGGRVIGTNRILFPLEDPESCTPPEYDRSYPFYPPSNNQLLFADDGEMDKAMCSDTTTACWRSWTLYAAYLSMQISAQPIELEEILNGTILLRRTYRKGGDPVSWNTPIVGESCNFAEHTVMHEVGHAFGIGGWQITDRGAQHRFEDSHPRNDSLSIMSIEHDTRYCEPQAYDRVTAMANYQSR